MLRGKHCCIVQAVPLLFLVEFSGKHVIAFALFEQKADFRNSSVAPSLPAISDVPASGWDVAAFLIKFNIGIGNIIAGNYVTVRLGYIMNSIIDNISGAILLIFSQILRSSERSMYFRSQETLKIFPRY